MSWTHWIGTAIDRLDSWWRRQDLRHNRPVRANPDQPLVRRLLLAPGQPRFLSWLAMLLVVSLALGPTLSPTSWGKIVLAMTGVAGLGLVNLLAHHRPPVARWLLLWQAVVLAAVCLAVWLLAGAGAREIEGGLYRHVGIAGVGLLLLALLIDWLVARALFGGFRTRLAPALVLTELFERRVRQGVASTSLWHAFFVVPFRQPLQLLFPGSLVLLVVPGDEGLWPWFVIPNLVAWAVLAAGGLSDRVQEMISTVSRTFFLGPPAVISITIVAVAISRLVLEIHYISYLFNLAGPSWNWTVLAYTLSAYALTWYYSHWSTRFELYHLLASLRGEAGPPWRACYPYSGSPVGATLAQGRSILLHGAGRFAVIGRYCKTSGETAPAFHFHRPDDLLLRVQRSAEENNQAEAGEAARILRHRSRFYEVVHVFLPYFLITALGLWLTTLPQKPELEVRASLPASFDLVAALKGRAPGDPCIGRSPDAPRIALAASGGGTRAAMYTASVLRGLAEKGHVCDVVLASGVSGGSVGLAYFAVRAEQLRSGGVMDRGAWDGFREAVTHPFIQDALDGVSEWRVVLATSFAPEAEAGRHWLAVRTGELLAESLEHRFEDGHHALGQVPIGLILNTSLAGASLRWRWDGDLNGRPSKELLDRYDAAACRLQDGDQLPGWVPVRDQTCRSLVTSAPAGGRLAITNLEDDVLSRPPGGPPALPGPMPTVVLRDATIPVVRAAALSANFPPVFSNAAIDYYPVNGALARRYWVTDGGAVENRATLTMLAALAAAAERLSDELEGSPDARLPPLHIVVADVSAPGGIYQQDRGIGSALAAGAQVGRAVERFLFERIRNAYGDRGQVFFHELAMPNALRSRGVGTHWMLPASIRLHCPAGVLGGEQGNCRKAMVQLSRDEVVALVEWLHRDTAAPPENDAAIVRTWIELDEENNHRSAWSRLLTCLKRADACD
jgi:hypothetical protein